MNILIASAVCREPDIVPIDNLELICQSALDWEKKVNGIGLEDE